MRKPLIHLFIKTTCGRAKFDELSTRRGPVNIIRLCWFIVIATLKDLHIPNDNQIKGSDS